MKNENIHPTYSALVCYLYFVVTLWNLNSTAGKDMHLDVWQQTATIPTARPTKNRLILVVVLYALTSVSEHVVRAQVIGGMTVDCHL